MRDVLQNVGRNPSKQGVKIMEKAAINKGSDIITRVGTAQTLTRTDSGTWTQLFPNDMEHDGNGSPMSSYPGSPLAGSPALTRVNTSAVGGLLPLSGTPVSSATRR